jgi:eukaryotic-like serine/threonine-protein kinase
MQAITDVDYTGQTVDHYAIVALIQGGAQGRVYRARDQRLQRDVAIKVLDPDFIEHERSRHGLIVEARTLSRLNHPHVAGVYDFVTHENRDFMVMEFVAGATLREVLAGGPLPPSEVARLGAQLARGLAAAHAAGILHCDIKPANLKITSAGLLKILDFGVARRLPAGALKDEHTTTNALSIVGTVPYMAPEVLRGDRADERSDIFSAATVLYEMATGVRAFPQRDLARLVDAIQDVDPPAPSLVNPMVPTALEKVVGTGMRKGPDARYQSATELAAALDALLSNGERHSEGTRQARPRWWSFGRLDPTRSAPSSTGRLPPSPREYAGP